MVCAQMLIFCNRGLPGLAIAMTTTRKDKQFMPKQQGDPQNKV